MNRARLSWAALFVVIFATTGSAHRLDEYLQATRIAVEKDRIDLEIDLTPGAAVANRIVSAIDRDRNDEISLTEKEMYVATLLASLTFKVDGETRPLKITNLVFPSIDEMRRGEGALRFRATASILRARAGAHRLTFANGHWQEIGAYMVNALVPTDERVHITGQSRDFLQREFALDYNVSPGRGAIPLASVLPVLLSLTLAATLYAVARRLPQ